MMGIALYILEKILIAAHSIKATDFNENCII